MLSIESAQMDTEWQTNVRISYGCNEHGSHEHDHSKLHRQRGCVCSSVWWWTSAILGQLWGLCIAPMPSFLRAGIPGRVRALELWHDEWTCQSA